MCGTTRKSKIPNISPRYFYFNLIIGDLPNNVFMIIYNDDLTFGSIDDILINQDPFNDYFGVFHGRKMDKNIKINKYGVKPGSTIDITLVWSGRV